MLDTTDDPRDVILERVFPNLRYGGDPDIERYFELRGANRTVDALSVYQFRLVPRYPDQAKRIILLRLYRQHSPQFAAYLKGLLYERADELISQLRKNIDALVARIATVNMRDTYAVLKAIENTSRLLPDDQDKARDFAHTYHDYAAILGYRKAEMSRLCYLLDEFYSQTSAAATQSTDFLAMSQATADQARQQEEDQSKKNFFDLSRINFDESDVRRIEIPAHLERNEDIALAYCYKYWLRIGDPAFERIIWLYARKYETRHYDIFRTIKICRLRKYSDDEILTMVTNCVNTEYSYTVQGDIYMQNTWKRLKANLYASLKPAPPAPLADQAPSQPSNGAAPAATPVCGQTAAKLAASQPAPNASAKQANFDPPSSTITVQPSAPAKSGQRARRVASVQPSETPPGRRASLAKTTSQAPAGTVLKPVRQRRGGTVNRLAARKSLVSASLPAPVAGGSISDYVKRLSGRGYDVYRDLFLARLRVVIRDELLKRRTRAGGLFDESINEAENVTYEFMEKNYNNSYMDWTGSPARHKLDEIGYRLENLDRIIEKCYGKINN